MKIPVHAFFARGTKPGEEPQLISAQYADIPDGLIAGEMAMAAVQLATQRADAEGASALNAAIARAREDGRINTL